MCCAVTVLIFRLREPTLLVGLDEATDWDAECCEAAGVELMLKSEVC